MHELHEVSGAPSASAEAQRRVFQTGGSAHTKALSEKKG